MARSGIASAADGTEIRYLAWGRPDAAHRIALVHSLAMTAEFWEGVAEELAEAWEVLAFDCRGHGASGKPPGPYTAELFADDLAAALDHAGWERALIGGASMGGCVAMAFAARHPDRTTGLALIDTTAWYGEGAPQVWEERAQKALTGGMEALVEFQKARWFSDAFLAANPASVDAALAVFLRNAPQAYAEACRMLGACDQRAALSGLRVPARVVVGAQDYATPVTMAEALTATIPGAVLTVLPDVRHFTPLEVPSAIAAEIAALAEGA